MGVTLASTEQITGTKVSLKTWEARQIAERMLADYDAHRPNEIFAERGTDWLTLDDAYIIQRAVAELRAARGERCIGFKVGCLSKPIQEQLGLHQPVRGYLWQNEALVSGSHIFCDSRGAGQGSRFVNLGIEGEIAVQLGRDISPETAEESSISDCIRCWFPVIELHNAVFRNPTPTSQELVAGNAMHAGLVAPPTPVNSPLAALARAEICVEIDGEVVETKSLAELPGGPLGSLRWLAASVSSSKQCLKAGDIVLTGSPGQLIPIEGSCAIAVMCEGQRVDLFVQAGHADWGF